MRSSPEVAAGNHDWQELRLDTFSAAKGGNVFYKAISHPLGAERVARLLAALADDGSVALYDPDGRANELAAIHDLASLDISEVYAQKVALVGKPALLGREYRPVTLMPQSRAGTILVAAFDAQRTLSHISALVPHGAKLVSLDEARLPETLLSDRNRYLSALNFATNFAFFRDGDGLHTRLVTANYWSRYGAKAPRLWCRLFAGDGTALATWEEPLPGNGGTVVIDSRDVRERFGLGPFAGQLFLHATGIQGHDVVKYALDVWSDHPGHLSCTHDANAWPSDRYAGLPAPGDGQTVKVWIQNSHPRPIPARAIGLARMGSEAFVPLNETIAPYASLALDTRALLPDAVWPAQLELRAGRHAVRPRYEIRSSVRSWIAHLNVERADLSPDPAIREFGPHLGRGFILAAPILPTERWHTFALPTPMAISQQELPVAVAAYGPDGEELARRPLGRVPRADCPLVDVDSLLGSDGRARPIPWGHVELVYDFAEGGEADGWLHAIFRYLDRANGHGAETSFGSHIFNTIMTFGNEPQSYSGPPPGLSTRLFVRLGHAPYETMLHLIYPASQPWLRHSRTSLTLVDAAGEEIAVETIEIPCGGSRWLRCGELFGPRERERAGQDAHVIVRDAGCRLFGYHGLVGPEEFSLDHLFGF